MKQVAEGVKANAPDAIVIVVSNPLDAMVYTFKQVSGFPKNRVVGMAGVLGAGGVEKIIELELDADERKLFDASVEHVRKLVSEIQ